MNKRGLLAALAAHGVPAAGAMLAALQLQDRRAAQPAAAAVVEGGMAGKEAAVAPVKGQLTSCEEDSLQHNEWAKLLTSLPAATCECGAAVGLTAGSMLGQLPKGAAQRGSCSPATVDTSLRGRESPSSVLLRSLRGCCAACSAVEVAGPRACKGKGQGKGGHKRGLSRGSSASDSEEESCSEGEADWGAPLAALHKAVAGKEGQASFYLPFDAEQADECQLASSHFKGGSPLWAFRDSAVERSFRTWHAGALAKVGLVAGGSAGGGRVRGALRLAPGTPARWQRWALAAGLVLRLGMEGCQATCCAGNAQQMRPQCRVGCCWKQWRACRHPAGLPARSLPIVLLPRPPPPPPQLDTMVCLALVLLLCTVASLSPEELRRPLHLWLLSTVARAPLILQPVLLLCPSARYAYRRCRWEPRRSRAGCGAWGLCGAGRSLRDVLSRGHTAAKHVL